MGISPDQFVFGVHADLGRVSRNVRFQPDFQIGIGDDHRVFAMKLPVHYVFPRHQDIQPYAGGGIAVGLRDRDGRSDSDGELAFVFTGGMQWRLRGGDSFFLELDLFAGDLHDAEVMAGFTFR